MTRFGWGVVSAIVAIVVLGGGVAWLYASPRTEPEEHADEVQTPEVNPAELSIYTSGEYGFSLFYPSIAVVADAYTASSTPISFPWRVHSSASGTPIVRLQKGTEEVRVGVSDQDLGACLRTGPGEESRGTFAVGSTTWQEFMFEKLGTEEEAQVTSYRVIHAKHCYAVEVFTPLNGQTDTSSFSLKDIITTFTFAQ